MERFLRNILYLRISLGNRFCEKNARNYFTVGMLKCMTFLHYENQDLMANDNFVRVWTMDHLCLRTALSSGPCLDVTWSCTCAYVLNAPGKCGHGSGDQFLFCRYTNCKAQIFLGPKSKFSDNSTLCSCVIFFSSFIPPFLSLPASCWEFQVISILIFDRMD